MAERLIPGYHFEDNSGTDQRLVPGGAFINETPEQSYARVYGVSFQQQQGEVVLDAVGTVIASSSANAYPEAIILTASGSSLGDAVATGTLSATIQTIGTSSNAATVIASGILLASGQFTGNTAGDANAIGTLRADSFFTGSSVGTSTAAGTTGNATLATSGTILSSGNANAVIAATARQDGTSLGDSIAIAYFNTDGIARPGEVLNDVATNGWSTSSPSIADAIKDSEIDYDDSSFAFSPSLKVSSQAVINVGTLLPGIEQRISIRSRRNSASTSGTVKLAFMNDSTFVTETSVQALTTDWEVYHFLVTLPSQANRVAIIVSE